jgi:hypothetical protein
VLRKTLKNSTSEPVTVPGAIPPRQLPEDLRICLEVIENDLLEGHVRLSEALKKRYEEQYPLVRSLADVFVSSVCSFIFVCLIIAQLCLLVPYSDRLRQIRTSPREGPGTGR